MKVPSASDPSAIVIPFGKHKGATVAELLAKDQAYADWIMAQGWVAERFAELHAALVSRGAGTDDTPEHNALQARFLDETFRTMMLWIAKRERLTYTRDKSEREIIARARRDIEQFENPHYMYGKTSAEEAAAARCVIDRVDLGHVTLTSLVQFEVMGADVVIEYGWGLDGVWQYEFKSKSIIEVKPAMGDDYPTVMRQMRRLNASVLVLGSYTGRGVSEPQLRQMFEASGMKLVFIQEIEEGMRRAIAR